jgi:hypothetical protein
VFYSLNSGPWDMFTARGTVRSVLPVLRAEEASEMRAALEDALELADDAIGYVSEHFVEKWSMRERLADCRKALLPRGVDVDERKQGRDL